ncbi:MAG: glycosyltransferase [Ignavibacteria bacterium]|nr:glycosyltransferase [Ignavibacteria bacterium]
MLYSICIATYKRPELLEKLLDSLSNQKLPESVILEFIIVDNDKSGSAKEVVEIAKKNSD